MRIVFQVCFALVALLALSLDTFADDVPVLDVQQICRGIASQAANPTERAVQICRSTIASKANRLSEAK